MTERPDTRARLTLVVLEALAFGDAGDNQDRLLLAELGDLARGGWPGGLPPTLIARADAILDRRDRRLPLDHLLRRHLRKALLRFKAEQIAGLKARVAA